MELKRVVVTGLGAVTPLGNNPEETWKAMLEGKSGAAPITYFDTTNFKAKFACEVKNLNVNDDIDRKEARKLDRYTQLALISAIQGVEDCGERSIMVSAHSTHSSSSLSKGTTLFTKPIRSASAAEY